MISCEQARNLFDGYLNDELSPSLTAELDAHRLKCSACQHQLALLEACGNVVRLDTSEPRVSEDFTDRLMAILEEDTRHDRWLQVKRGMTLTSGLLGIAAAIALVVWVFSEPAPSPVNNRVAGEKSSPPPPVSAAGLITELPIGALFDITDSFYSTVELGQYEINHLRDTLDLNAASSLDDYQDFRPPVPLDPDPDIIDTLPELDDGGELM